MIEPIPIITDKKALSNPCQSVPEADGFRIGELLVEQLKLRSDHAVGLAANQIGIDARVFALRVGEEYKYFINPEILSMENPGIFLDEGCLSFPGQRVNTIRFDKVLYKDALAEGVLHNFAAVAFQHELQHLNGGTMFESAIPKAYDLCFCGSGKKFKFCHMR